MSTPAAAFISYSREDSDFALRLAQDLKSAGAAIWLDQVDIHPGVSWDNAIEDALREAPQMLVVLTPTSVRSENVRNEISYALRKGKIIVPVLYQDCDIPLRLERTQHIDFRSDYACGLKFLLAYLNVDSPNPAIPQQAAEADTQRLRQLEREHKDRTDPAVKQAMPESTQTNSGDTHSTALAKLDGPFRFVGRASSGVLRLSLWAMLAGVSLCILTLYLLSDDWAVWCFYFAFIITIWGFCTYYLGRINVRVYYKDTPRSIAVGLLHRLKKTTLNSTPDCDVYLTKRNDNRVLSFIVPDGSWREKEEEERIREIATCATKSRFLLQMLDSRMQIRKTFQK